MGKYNFKYEIGDVVYYVRSVDFGDVELVEYEIDNISVRNGIIAYGHGYYIEDQLFPTREAAIENYRINAIAQIYYRYKCLKNSHRENDTIQ